MESNNTDYRIIGESSLIPGYKWIVQDKEYMGGRPAIIGSRMSIEMILDDMAHGWTEKDMEEQFDLPIDAVREALRYACDIVAGNRSVIQYLYTINEDSITVTLHDEREISIPLAWSDILFKANPIQLEDFKIDAFGYSIHWPALDETISIKTFINGLKDGVDSRYSPITVLQLGTKTMTAFLEDGRRVSLPIAWSERLAQATPEELKNFEIEPSRGYSIYWKAVDETITLRTFVDGLRRGRIL